MNVETGKSRKIPVNANVDLLVRRVSITETGSSPIEAIELREFLKNVEAEGHGIFIPADSRQDLAKALVDLAP